MLDQSIAVISAGVPLRCLFTGHSGHATRSSPARGNDPKSNSDYSRITNARTVDRLAGLVAPSRIIAGGKSDRDAHYLQPTLLFPITWDDKILEDEIFGPIPPTLTYTSFDEAMMRMAKTGRPLAALIFAATRKPSTGSSANGVV
ncbi:aldehyde dehydrogenase family protein [Bradyrhizobium sp. F1.13.3]|uniref:aldehyde dehydrogenase family protein n=1 Tax=Bradyrhizobium sp. F1.13.3 TaxID=3156351 RepID=UPI003398F8A0